MAKLLSFNVFSGTFDYVNDGDVVGPASSTDNAIARFNGTTGKLLENSSVLINDSGYVGIGIAPTTIPFEILYPSSSAAFVPIQKYNVTDIATGRQDVITFAGGATANRGMQITVQELTAGGVDVGFGISGFRFFLNEVRMFHEGAYYLSFWSTNLERMRILATGEMGLGITTPTAKLHIKQVLATSGTAKSLIVDNFNHTAQTASTEISNVEFNTYTRTWAAGALTTQRENVFYAPTYAFASASTITTAATLAITGAPITGTNATITRSFALWVQGGNTAFTGANVYIGTQAPASPAKLIIQGDGSDVFSCDNSVGSRLYTLANSGLLTLAGAVRINGGQMYSGAATNMLLYTLTAGTSWVIFANVTDRKGLVVAGPATGTMAQNHFEVRQRYNAVGNEYFIVDASGYSAIGKSTATAYLDIAGYAAASGTVKSLVVNPAAHTNQTASTEINNILVNTYTRQWATGNITTQREFRINGPVYTFVGASTIEKAATLSIAGSPFPGANATITQRLSFWVESGISLFGANSVYDLNLPVQLDAVTGGEANFAVNKNGAYGFLLGFKNTTSGYPNIGPFGYMRMVTSDPFTIMINNTTNSTLWASNTDVAIGGTITDKTLYTGAIMLVKATGLVGINQTAPHSSLQVNGSFATARVTKTGDYTLTASDFKVDTTTNSFTITLPTAVGIDGRIYVIKNKGSGTTITVNTTSSQTIDGAASGTVLLSYPDALMVQSDGANWDVI